MRQPLALMDATATAQVGHSHPDVQRLPDTLRMHIATTNQISQIRNYEEETREKRKAT
jgi:hypothetical protein